MDKFDALRLHRWSAAVAARKDRITSVVVTTTRGGTGLVIRASFMSGSLIVAEVSVITNNGNAEIDLERAVRLLVECGWIKQPTIRKAERTLNAGTAEGPAPVRPPDAP